jgi:hypothetical protein
MRLEIDLSDGVAIAMLTTSVSTHNLPRAASAPAGTVGAPCDAKHPGYRPVQCARCSLEREEGALARDIVVDALRARLGL